MLRIALLLVLLLGPGSAAACTVFHAEGLVGANLDLDDPLPGWILYQPSGLRKESLPWRGSAPAVGGGGTCTWVSRHASLTLTCYGRDFVEGGMNDAGLVVEQASVAAPSPPADGRPSLSCAQWIQYQLDRWSTVPEVIAHRDDLRLDGEGWHFLVADRSGRVAVLEPHRGGVDAIQGEGLPVPCITNTPFRQAMAQLPLDRRFGGGISMADGEGAHARFVRVADLLRQSGEGDAVARVLSVLDSVAVVDTRRQVVYDPHSGRLIWRTPGDRRLRWLAFPAGEEGGVRGVRVEAPGEGDRGPALRAYPLDANRACAASLLEPGAADRVARHPYRAAD